MPENSSTPPRLATLDSIARSIRRAQENTGVASALLRHSPEEARAMCITAKDQNTAALNELELLGARIPAVDSDEPAPESKPVPLHLLDTPASRRLLTLLEETADAALAVDRERGWLDADGDSVGLAESVEQLAIGLRYDVYGAPGGRD